MEDKNGKKEFLNVYNFVPLAKKKAEKYTDQDELTGVISYTITTRTPLFIPNTSSDHAFQMGKDVPVEHKSYDFYSYREMEQDKTYDDSPEKPVLPGSELRGMIRGIYETLTDSCMGVLNEDEVPSLRTDETFKPGLLHRCEENQLELVKANKYRYRMDNDKSRHTYKETKYQEGQKVYYKKVPYRESIITECKDESEGKFSCDGYLIKGMGDRSLGKKYCAGIFSQNMKKQKSEKEFPIKLTDKDIERLKGVLNSYREQPEAEENCYQEYKEKLEEFLGGKGELFFPVYYSIIDGNILYLSPACITRELSQHTIGKLAGEFAPCKNAETMCPACDLFGRIGDSNEDAHVSKLRFSDAYPEKELEIEKYYETLQPVTLETLSGPKLGNVEFYLYRPEKYISEIKKEASFWTYDYYVMDGELYIEPGRLRGRKYYWHQPNRKLPAGIEKTKLNKTIRPVAEKITFLGKVYFDKISKKQLDQIIWILNCGADGSDLSYKLGAGKPLGLGSVKCEVLEVTERTIDTENGHISYHEKKYKPTIPAYETLNFTECSKEEFLLMNTFHAAEGIPQISYPVTEEQYGKPVQEGFKWFVQNHSENGGNADGEDKKSANKKSNSRKKMIIHESLPLASSVRCLPCRVGEKNSPPVKEQDVFNAKVTGYKKGKNGSIAYLELQVTGIGKRTIQCKKIKKKEKIPDDSWETSFPKGTRIKIKKTGQTQGTNGKMYDDFQYIGRA
jgi:CRISPR-associated protein (TIGR03986 family)